MKRIIEKTDNILVNSFGKTDKCAILVTVCFFFIMMYVSVFHHIYFYETDGMHYLQAGEQILHGDKNAVKLFDAPIGGPVLYATLNEFVQDGFVTLKTIALLSATGIIFFSYFILKNIFNNKIALLSQLFFAFSLRMQLESIWAMNEALPLLLTYASLYFIIKRQSITYLAITGSLLGISFMIRYSCFFVLIGIIVFLLIYSKKGQMKLVNPIIIVVFFLMASSPLLIYNISTYGHFIDSDPIFYMIFNQKYQTQEWRSAITSSDGINTLQIIFIDSKLFLENYFYNLFYQNPNFLFNFNSWTNLSIIPLPFIGMIPVIGGLMYCVFPKLNSRHLVFLICTIVITTLLILLFGDFKIHFFAIVIVPALVLGILNIKNIEKNRSFLLIISIVFLFMVSIVTIQRSDFLLSIWILMPALSALFLLDVIPKMCSRISNKKYNVTSKRIKTTVFIIILFILITNVGFSYKGFLIYLYQDKYTDFKTEFIKLFQNNDSLSPNGISDKEIADVLAKQPNIENSYVMAGGRNYAYLANSKFLYTSFQEGIRNDTLDRFISRENWSDFDRDVSNSHSYPFDRYNKLNPIPDYLVYENVETHALHLLDLNATQYEDLKILSDPNNPKIPKNFEFIYKSNRTGSIIYKINHIDQ